MTPTLPEALQTLQGWLPPHPADDTPQQAAARVVVGATAMTPAGISAERANGWEHFHPEDYCHRCGRPNCGNGGWWVDSDRWNLAVAGLERGTAEILCPTCFVELWEQATGLKATWQLVPAGIRAVDYEPPWSVPLDVADAPEASG